MIQIIFAFTSVVLFWVIFFLLIWKLLDSWIKKKRLWRIEHELSDGRIISMKISSNLEFAIYEAGKIWLSRKDGATRVINTETNFVINERQNLIKKTS